MFILGGDIGYPVYYKQYLGSTMDICISAARTTLYEICACGVPLITYSLADNQIFGAKAFENLGLGINIGGLS